MSISAPFIARPIATWLLAIAILLGGAAGLSGAAGLRAAAGGFPHHRGDDAASRRQPADRFHADHRVAGTPARRNPRAGEHDLREFRGHQPDHAAIQPGSRHRFRVAGRAGGDQCGSRHVARQPALSADLLQGEPGRCADPDLGADLRFHPHRAGQRCRRYAAATETGRDRRRGKGHRGGRAAARRAGARGSGAARGRRRVDGRRAHRDRQRQHQRRQGRVRRGADGGRRWAPTTSWSMRISTTTWSSPGATARR